MSVEKQKNMNIIDEFKIERFQNFQKYLKINPINIQITHPKIQNNLFFFMQIDINIDLLQIPFYLVHEYKKIKMQFLLQQTD